MTTCDNCKKEISEKYYNIYREHGNHEYIFCNECFKWIFPKIDLREMCFETYRKKQNCFICGSRKYEGWLYRFINYRSNEDEQRVGYICGTCFRAQKEKFILLKL